METAGDDDADGNCLPSDTFLSEPRHNQADVERGPRDLELGLVSKWRMKDRMKTGCVALVMCLNIGVDPPDVIKISPCARVECWLDPFATQPQKALDAIGQNLQAQYERWQPKAKFRVQLDPTVEDVKKVCASSRRSARQERVLLHYNGHGVPRPTSNGEVWVFNKSYTQYIPLSVYELDSWLGTPAIYVFDCSAAGLVVNAFCERPEWAISPASSSASLASLDAAPSAAPPSPAGLLGDRILLAACGAEEALPQSPELPADVFTACLTTPIKMALTWFCPRSLLRDSLPVSLIDQIPGRQNDRKTPLGELHWVFTAVTDTIAWNLLPRDLFQRLFRQDLLLASLFRNFLLADRVMRSAGCTPRSLPALPPTHQHHLWNAWDMAAEMCLAQVPALLADPNRDFRPSPFFAQQLTAFDVWLQHAPFRAACPPPEQLPIVLQVLLSPSHRLRALVLLARFLDIGPWAVDLALSVGIFPYVLKLLQTSAAELRQVLVFIWAKILPLDKSCQQDLIKDAGHLYFIKCLELPPPAPPSPSGAPAPPPLPAYPSDPRERASLAFLRATAAFVLALVCEGSPRGHAACLQAGLVPLCLQHIQSAPPAEPLLLQWLCLCLAQLWEGAPAAQEAALLSPAVPRLLEPLLAEPQPEVRAAAVAALASLLRCGAGHSRPPAARSVGREGGRPAEEGGSAADWQPQAPPGPEATGGAAASAAAEAEEEQRLRGERVVLRALLKAVNDASPLVRRELARALVRVAHCHRRSFQVAAAAYLRKPGGAPAEAATAGASAAAAPTAGGLPADPSVLRGSRQTSAVPPPPAPPALPSSAAAVRLQQPAAPLPSLAGLRLDRSGVSEGAGAAGAMAAGLGGAGAAAATAAGAAPSAAARSVGGASPGPTLQAASGGLQRTGQGSAGGGLPPPQGGGPAAGAAQVPRDGGSGAALHPLAEATRASAASFPAAALAWEASASSTYLRALIAVYAMSRDPFPPVAAAARQALSLIGASVAAAAAASLSAATAAAAAAALSGQSGAAQRATDGAGDAAGLYPPASGVLPSPMRAPVPAFVAALTGSPLRPSPLSQAVAAAAAAADGSAGLPLSHLTRSASWVAADGAIGHVPQLPVPLSSAAAAAAAVAVAAADPAAADASPFLMRRAVTTVDFGPVGAGAAPRDAAGPALASREPQLLAGLKAAVEDPPPPPPAPPPPHRSLGAAAAAHPPAAGREEAVAAPRSPFFAWSAAHFTRPLLEAPVDADADARREQREEEALAAMRACQASKETKVSDQIASFDAENEMTTEALLLDAFRPLVCLADETETLRVWNYEEGTTVNTFDNQIAEDARGVAHLSLVNELDDPLLLVGSREGSVRVWRDFTVAGKQQLATAFQALPPNPATLFSSPSPLPPSLHASVRAPPGLYPLTGSLPSAVSMAAAAAAAGSAAGAAAAAGAAGRRGPLLGGTVTAAAAASAAGGAEGRGPLLGSSPGRAADARLSAVPGDAGDATGSPAAPSACLHWQQRLGFLFAAGPLASVMVWDLRRELLAHSVATQADAAVTAMSSAAEQPHLLAAGADDGAVRLFDLRAPPSQQLAALVKLHRHRVVGLEFHPQPAAAPVVISASCGGDVQFLDTRALRAPTLSLEAHKGHLTALAVHQHAPILATGSSKQLIKVFNLEGELLSVVRYHQSFLGQRIGPVSCLRFHPFKILLAAGANDSIVSIYAGDDVK